MIAYPHGETNITFTCQNRCVSCNHFIPVQDAWFADPEIIRHDLNICAKVMHFDVYNLVGGEPTLHPEILNIIAIVRESGITDRVEITSNGQNFERLPDEFFRAIDDLIITPYKLTDIEKNYIIEKCSDHGVCLQWHPVIFTYVAYKQPHSQEVAANLYHHCWYNINRHVIDEGYFYRCCTAPFIPSILLDLPKETDGLPVDGIAEEGLNAYMSQSDTPVSCMVCGSNCAAQLEWREQPDRKIWFEESLA